MVKDPEELYVAINTNKDSWEAGCQELFDSSIPVWFKSTARRGIADRWASVKNNYLEHRNEGLEAFLHLLNENAAFPKLKTDKPEIKISGIQSGQIINTDLIFTNETRGYVQSRISLSKKLDGVVLAPELIRHNSAASLNHSRATLTIDSSRLLKGVNYQTSILVDTSVGQKIEIPISFQIVFPKNAFILEIAKMPALSLPFLPCAACCWPPGTPTGCGIPLIILFGSTRHLITRKIFICSDFASPPS